jgi:acyl-CoA thioesterase YciA
MSTPTAPESTLAPNVQRELVLRMMPMPADANANGDVFGGWIMAQVDLAGSVLPARISRGRIATVAVNEFIFKQPVSVGDLLSFYSSVVRIGRTSITVHVEVAIDKQGKPREIPR